ncbi:uncharacterized protein MYCFIDRAFT_196538 [Pseudocercospora fijiensis CIRAD86]|uniref:F-box domain-containing protein n=1 Tax=Pseudocercospora fijiensis (strain CIRAD86) TaxID=383855 RepID=M2YZZ7_PSEFD|nr:uncharacterized protein MYCFIDRAFT_196538 [Pseudocercospora fijiensis CIRAD86]EME83185.1 hypothetical protein MYCFIDRAFT_196538 [Pseudocercospora fijiensis CIRAD86]
MKATASRISKRRETSKQMAGKEVMSLPQTAGCSTSLRPATSVRSIFPFLELPPELRNQVYEDCMSDADESRPRHRDLATLRIPTISRVSRQLRQESMGYLFESRAFDLCVGTNIRHRCDATNGYQRWPPAYDPVQDCGTMGLNPVVRSFLKSAAKWAIFKDVTISIYNTHDIPLVRYKRDRPSVLGKGARTELLAEKVEQHREKKRLAFVHLKVEKGKVVWHDEHGLARYDYRPSAFGKIDEAVADLKQVVNTSSSRPDFKGFTVGDLHQISKSLYWRPDLACDRRPS